jgi:hypothetical protein
MYPHRRAGWECMPDPDERMGASRSRRRSVDLAPLHKRDGIKFYVDLSLANLYDV